MANQCSKLNPDCLVPKGTPCPAYETDKNCWEYDWIPVLKSLPEEEQKQWGDFMSRKCPQCPAFREPMKDMMERMKKEL